MVGVVSQPTEGDPRERGPREVEATSSLGREQGPQHFVLLGRGETPPILFPPGQLRLADHDLHGLGQTVGDEGRTQDGVTCKQAFPGASQGRRIHRTLQDEVPLLEPEIGLRSLHRMEELLHGRQRVDVLERAKTLGQTIQGRLFEASQREVGRRVSPGLHRPAMVDQLAQDTEKRPGQPFDRLRPVPVLAVDPTNLEGAVANQSQDLEGMPSLPNRAVPGLAGLAAQSAATRR